VLDNWPKHVSIVLPQEVKMADIMKDDVRTYVKDLIAKEFGTNPHAEKVLSDNPQTITGESRNGERQPFYNQPSMERQVENWRQSR
jgi:hypothetical protein